MCGFVAICGAQREHELKRMAAAVERRGPDDQGAFEDSSFAAIHHRLSIIGPDERGRQPMTREDVTVVFNGCIYNYRELRAQLETDGIVFLSDSDTEILPHLYRRFGVGMFSLLNGMFAIVIWDARQKLLLAARDAFGEKPLFICEQGGRAGFASSLSAFEKGDWNLTPDVQAIRDVLTRMRVEAPRTMYQEVSQLPAGCYARMMPGGALQVARYFFLPPLETFAEPESDIKAMGGLLDEVFLSRSVSDKPMGVFLSGGIDSSLIAESLARQLPGTLHTFSVRFADGAPDYDESMYARKVAHHIASDHKVLEVHAEAHETLYQLAAAFDQPVANTAALPTWLISRECKAFVDVALSGVGGDEMFGGYPRYLGMAWHERLRRVPGRWMLLSALRGMDDAKGSRNLRGRLRRLLEGLDLPADIAYQSWTSSAAEPWAEMFTLPETFEDKPWAHATGPYHGLEGLLATYGPEQGAMAYDVLTYLPDDLLAVGDRMSMAHALELRAPFLDIRLLNAAMALPASAKVTGMPWKEGLKLLLKDIARSRLPADVVDRPKQGFMAPVKHWLRGPLDDEVQRLCDGRPVGGLVRPEYVQRMQKQHAAGRDRSDVMWALLLLDVWMAQRGWSLE
ncbi:MAG: asparagine synthase (glutamine-hydrolyzing) [Zetaproteobacteria bacterium CG06_land_8_20_14_3_00_59_53]|nr:MAG: asparagine synthase (glutamine-hydrolyzing) [Zetaproteobacteria bacterium CG2_30_59_37]PIO88883.1 MAG: asparagine synthase (glutamine-hydrolyzing) [Zetaproteobacteria bacterium CG23_combo_of_CG06-09_8_20_14_all_59_86]PIQ65187.1 MAG: asparagine synthase (glutamine-hydrolyzing) [Zetaproteobacteria bacterium CG11_big_fil_rev_8_21_14_0_20_59_439]PIU70766.1 MAG: asparagine synthase (glutamine-hydrolyzing) [Zetaproteobacteria bacterium CG06_land_8_20_14_3_00_59_53]PIU96436.1 MAG: asparagine s